MNKKLFCALSSLLLIFPAISYQSFKANAETEEHKLTLTSGTLKMGGTYGTTSAYYKVKGNWDGDSESVRLANSGFILNSMPCDSSINMSYKANSESYVAAVSGYCYGAIRMESPNCSRIGSQSGQAGFLEITRRYSSSSGAMVGKVFSEVSNPVTLRYDATQGKRTSPDYSTTYGLVAKGGASSYSTVAAAYANYKCNYFGIGWYYATYTCDLTNLCFYDDNYNSLGCTLDNDAPDNTSVELYGATGARIYVYNPEETVIGFKGVDSNNNPVTINGFQDEGNDIYSFIMPDSDAIISLKQKQTTLNISIDEETYDSLDIDWSLDNLKSSLNSIKLGNYQKVIGYQVNGKLFASIDDLFDYVSSEPKTYELNITVKTAELILNKQADMRVVIGSTGLRFKGKVKGEVESYGMIVTKFDKLESLDKFTKEDMVTSNYRDVNSLNEGFNFYDEGGYHHFSAYIKDMKETNIVSSYIARLYVSVKYDNNETKRIYSDTDESYATLPYEAGLISAYKYDEDYTNSLIDESEYEIRKSLINQYYDPVLNIDNSYHLIGNGRNYTIEKVSDGKIKVVPLNDMFKAEQIKYLLINGISIPFTRNNDIITFSKGCIESISLKNAFNGGELDIYSTGIRRYLDAKTEQEQAAVLKNYSGNSYDKQIGTLSWNSVGSQDYYLIYISEDNTFLDAYSFKTSSTSFVPGILIPNRTYYYKVVAIKDNKVLTQSDVDTFVTCDDYTLRQVNIDGVKNVRDEGGWKTESGKTVKYNLVYRGATLNGRSGSEPTTSGLYTINNVLKWNSEIDFRTTGSDDIGSNGKAQYENYFDATKPYVKGTITQFAYTIPGWSQTSPVSRSYDSRTKNSLKAIFTNMSDIKNYPVYFHCNAGADRTGTFGYLLLGYLGVDYADLCKDLELTSFSSMGARWRSAIVFDGNGGYCFDDTGVMQDDSGNYVAFGKYNRLILEKYGTGDGKISSAIGNYLVNEIGVKQAELDSLKQILLG